VTEIKKVLEFPEKYMGSKFRRNLILGIAALVVVRLIVVTLMSILAANSEVKMTQQIVNVYHPCGDNCVQYDGDWLGFTIPVKGSSLSVARGSLFTLMIDPRNQDPVASHQITNIVLLTKGFNIISVVPALPLNLNANSNVSISIQVQAPNVTYSGPLIFNLTTM
jgi:hypothetical protein